VDPDLEPLAMCGEYRLVELILGELRIVRCVAEAVVSASVGEQFHAAEGDHVLVDGVTIPDFGDPLDVTERRRGEVVSLAQ
jgi:hypothetical protein